MKKVSTRFIIVCALIVLLAFINIAYFATTKAIPEQLLTADIGLMTTAVGFYFGGRQNKTPETTNDSTTS